MNLTVKLDHALAADGRLEEAKALIRTAGKSWRWHDAIGDRRAIASLKDGDHTKALAEAVRAANKFPDRAENRALLAHIAGRVGCSDLATRSMARAVDLDPGNPAYQLALLRDLANSAPNALEPALRRALPHMDADRAPILLPMIRAAGLETTGACRRESDRIDGWVTSRQDAPVRLQVTFLIGDTWPAQTLEIEGSAGTIRPFQVEWPKDADAGTVKIMATGERLPGAPLFSMSPSRTAGRIPPSTASPLSKDLEEAAQPVTVVIPLYDDVKGVETCLESVLNAKTDLQYRLLLVLDAPPDQRISDLAMRYASHPDVELLTNAENLGFTASVNRALSCAENGDVILLNSDTLVGDRWIDRLQAATHSAPDVGTVTPLSNNGEIASFPKAGRKNPLPARMSLASIDAAAERVNGGAVVDLPTGIGFCFYIRRACLDAVGLLDAETFGRGYGEETDFCMRARALGWRSVCAPGVFVAHTSMTSFGDEKDDLVGLNMPKVAEKHADYRRLTRTFVRTRPLRPSKRALARELLREAPLRLSVVAVGPSDWRTSERYTEFRFQAATAGEQCVWLYPDRDRSGRVWIESDTRSGPGALYYDLPQETEALLEDLARLQVTAFHVVFDAGHDLQALLASGGVPVIHHCLDPAWEKKTAVTPADTAVVYSDFAEQMLRGRAPGIAIDRRQAPPLTIRPPNVPASHPRIAVVHGAKTRDGYQKLLALARAAASSKQDIDFVVFEKTIDDLALHRTGRVICLGDVEPPDRAMMFEALNASLALSVDIAPDPVGLGVQIAAETGPALAFFDGGARAERANAHPLTLSLAAAAPAEDLLRHLERFIKTVGQNDDR
ncbi:MAG: glycosyltransferase [Roseibium sp.]|nr:glycosyltransferase [Roseibium sp.]